MPYEIRCYKIWWENNPEAGEYVGSTKETLAKRMTAHRRDVKKGKTQKIFEAIRKHGRFQYIMLESCMVNSNDEKRMREQEWIDELKPSLNMYRAFLNDDDRKQDSRERTKQWRDANREEVNKKSLLHYHTHKDANRERRNKNSLLYYHTHKDANRERRNKSRQANREEINKKQR